MKAIKKLTGEEKGIPFPTVVLLRAHQFAWQFALDLARPSFLEAARKRRRNRLLLPVRWSIYWVVSQIPFFRSLTNHRLSNISAFYDKSGWQLLPCRRVLAVT